MLRGEPNSLHTSGEESEADGDGSDQKTDGHPFFEESYFRNFALLVEDRRIWVNREYLGKRSEVFREMFVRGSKENRNEVELPEKKVDEIIELLRVIVPKRDKYQCEPVTRESFHPFRLYPYPAFQLVSNGTLVQICVLKNLLYIFISKPKFISVSLNLLCSFFPLQRKRKLQKMLPRSGKVAEVTLFFQGRTFHCCWISLLNTESRGCTIIVWTFWIAKRTERRDAKRPTKDLLICCNCSPLPPSTASTNTNGHWWLMLPRSQPSIWIKDECPE